MNQRRGRGGMPLSLFSFQDVITSITGIMILVVLFLVLEVIMRKSLEAPAVQSQEGAVSATTEAVVAMRREKAGLQEDVEQGRARAAGLPRAGAWQIRRDLRRARAEGEELARRKGELVRAIRQRAGLSEAGEDDRQELERQVRELQLRLEQLERLLAQLKRQDHVTFAFEETRKTPIIVQCSDEQIRAQPLSGREEVSDFPVEGGPAVATAFLQWTRQKDAERDGFFLVIKPSAAPYAGRLVDSLKDAGFDVGYEPLEEAKSAVFERESLP